MKICQFVSKNVYFKLQRWPYFPTLLCIPIISYCLSKKTILLIRVRHNNMREYKKKTIVKLNSLTELYVLIINEKLDVNFKWW